MYELIFYIEEQFCGIGVGWFCIFYGGLIGGWEVLVVQVLYLDDYGICYVVCFDLIDFWVFCFINIYEDKNVYYLDSDFKCIEVFVYCDYLGNVNSILKDMNQCELVLGIYSCLG